MSIILFDIILPARTWPPVVTEFSLDTNSNESFEVCTSAYASARAYRQTHTHRTTRARAHTHEGNGRTGIIGSMATYLGSSKVLMQAVSEILGKESDSES